MRTELSCGAARLAAVLAGAAVIGSVPAALGADVSGPRLQAATLREQDRALGDRTQEALQTLYALEGRLARARAAAAALDSRTAAVARERGSVRRRLAVARRAVQVSQRRLARLVRALYEQDAGDPLALVLGAASLDDALTGLDSLNRAAAENRRVLRQARQARGLLVRLDARLAAREAELRGLTAAAAAHTRALQKAAAERAGYVASLRRRRDLTAAQIAGLAVQARTAAERSAAPAQPSAIPQPPPAPGAGPRTLTVSAVGYSLRGRTASGLPVGHGIAAVDPSVIPLGTRFSVPGYGDAVAADTGSAIQGATIDLWFPSVAEAQAWGRRTVVITVG